MKKPEPPVSEPSPKEEGEENLSDELARLEDDKEVFTAPVILARPHQEKSSRDKSGGETKNIVAVSFHKAGKIYDFDAQELKLNASEQVIVDTDDGLGFATVVIPPRPESIANLDRALKRIIRKATLEDLRQHERNKERERRAYQVCQEKIKSQKLPMKLVQVEFLHSGAKAVFAFSSESRVDFRQLVRELASEFHTRIEMKQIGPRDEAKIMGSIGVCGRELCCSTWLRDFDPISIKMAKEQELSLNPSKLAGQCGRLKCCLAYEYEVYREEKRALPKIGKKVCWKDGTDCGKVIGHNIFSQKVVVVLEDGSQRQLSPDEIQIGIAQKPHPSSDTPH